MPCFVSKCIAAKLRAWKSETEPRICIADPSGALRALCIIRGFHFNCHMNLRMAS